MGETSLPGGDARPTDRSGGFQQRLTGVLPDDASLLAQPPTLALDGKVVWVTGASRGLGRAIAFALAGAGAELLLMARSSEALDDVAGTIRQAGGVAHVAVGSVSSPTDVAAAAAQIEQRWGRLDALINNAGISPSFRRSEAVDDDEFLAVLQVNLAGPFMTAKAALPLLEPGGGSIVNVSSIHGTTGHERLAAYAASKGGLELLTRTLAVEWAPRGVRVNSIAPGYLNTDMTTWLRGHEHWGAELLAKIPMRRFGEPAEIVASVLFLAGPASSYITGATLFADGGWTAQ
jgi:NAD(P)-dependent dehydrogenase (short-subunit alcohol dehydrogenase family)